MKKNETLKELRNVHGMCVENQDTLLYFYKAAESKSGEMSFAGVKDDVVCMLADVIAGACQKDEMDKGSVFMLDSILESMTMILKAHQPESIVLFGKIIRAIGQSFVPDGEEEEEDDEEEVVDEAAPENDDDDDDEREHNIPIREDCADCEDLPKCLAEVLASRGYEIRKKAAKKEKK